MQHDFEDEENPQTLKENMICMVWKCPEGSFMTDWFDEFNITSLVYS